MTLPGFTADACLYGTPNLYQIVVSPNRIPLTESDVRNLHRRAVQRSNPDIAGLYANVGRHVTNESGRYGFPAPAEIPALMREFAKWLSSAPNTPATAFSAHQRLVSIHPFQDGNGRTARLLMNLILARGGYPTIALRPEDRHSYNRALHRSQTGHGPEGFDTFLYDRLSSTLDRR